VKTSTINLSIPKDLLEKADREAKKESRSRSELMRAALRLYIDRQTRLENLFARIDDHVKKLGLGPVDVEAAIQEYRASKKR
jgi:CopG family transcriptional regulator / antitoxin EndoAI